MLKDKIRKAVYGISKYVPLWRERVIGNRTFLDIQRTLQDIQKLQAIHYFNQELERNSRNLDPRVLYQYGFQVNSQSYEDGIIHEIFRRIKVLNRTFVEIGIGDGTENNTAFLLAQGWKGFWIDGNDSFLDTMRVRGDLQNGCIKFQKAFVAKDNISNIFSQLKVPEDIDLLSIDVDQNTYYIWEALREFKPRVVTVEYNAAIPPDIDWKVAYVPAKMWDGTQNFGASLKAFEILGNRLGYSLVGCDCLGANAFFVRNDLLADHFFAPFTSENHYQPIRYKYMHRKGHPNAILDRGAE
ncbi:MAG: hypothetical protein NUV91_00245 [Candidatus Omnitrophica bacterium]|nr:hypothetical protein [Candidatus Omnitrophota bacterium]